STSIRSSKNFTGWRTASRRSRRPSSTRSSTWARPRSERALTLQRDSHDQSSRRALAQLDRTAVACDHIARDREAKTEPGGRRIASEERLEDLLPQRRDDSRTVVLD